MLLKEDYKKKFKRCILEYTNASDFDVVEAGEAPEGGEAPMSDAPMGGDPSMNSGAPMGNAPAGGEAPMGGAPEGGEAPMEPGMEGGAAPEGFAPQGVDQSAGLDGMGGDPNAAPMANAPVGGEDEEVIDVDELTNSQEDTERKIDDLSSKFERLMGSIEGLEKRIDNINSHTDEYLDSLKDEIEKRNPTPMQRLTMRSTKSAPYEMTPNEYMNNYAPENYSAESDENGADDPQYKITKADIDNFTDYNSIAKEFDGKLGLRDILDF